MGFDIPRALRLALLAPPLPLEYYCCHPALQ